MSFFKVVRGGATPAEEAAPEGAAGEATEVVRERRRRPAPSESPFTPEEEALLNGGQSSKPETPGEDPEPAARLPLVFRVAAIAGPFFALLAILGVIVVWGEGTRALANHDQNFEAADKSLRRLAKAQAEFKQGQEALQKDLPGRVTALEGAVKAHGQRLDGQDARIEAAKRAADTARAKADAAKASADVTATAVEGHQKALTALEEAQRRASKEVETLKRGNERLVTIVDGVVASVEQLVKNSVTPLTPEELRAVTEQASEATCRKIAKEVEDAARTIEAGSQKLRRALPGGR